MALIHDDDLDLMFMDGAVRSYSISVDCTTPIYSFSLKRIFNRIQLSDTTWVWNPRYTRSGMVSVNNTTTS
jgi:hypothetical protein